MAPREMTSREVSAKESKVLVAAGVAGKVKDVTPTRESSHGTYLTWPEKPPKRREKREKKKKDSLLITTAPKFRTAMGGAVMPIVRPRSGNGNGVAKTRTRQKETKRHPQT